MDRIANNLIPPFLAICMMKIANDSWQELTQRCHKAFEEAVHACSVYDVNKGFYDSGCVSTPELAECQFTKEVAKYIYLTIAAATFIWAARTLAGRMNRMNAND